MTSANPPQVHANPRALFVDRTGAEIHSWLQKLQEERQLTGVEMLLILTDVESRILKTLIT